MASRLYGYFLSSWKNQTIDEAGLQIAVSKNYITQAEYETIIATEQYNMVNSEETL